MRLLVTGCAGFIGSHLVERLLERGHEVVGVDALTPYYDPAAKLRNLAEALDHPRFRFVEGDLNELDADVLLDGIDVVHHLAGQPGVRASWGTDFGGYLDHNVLATQRLLEAAKAVGGGPRVVFASSSSIYGQAERFPTGEDDAPRPVSPYGVSKLAAEHLCRLYASQHGLDAVILRYFTIFGPRQRPDMAFTRFIEAIASGGVVSINGDGRQSRNFTFVGDCVDGTIAAGERGRTGATYNIAGGSQATVLEVVETLARLIGRDARVEHRPAVPGDPAKTGADIRRAQRDLGYHPAVTLEAGLGLQVEAQRAPVQGT